MAQGHSVDEYLETIYFLAFPIGEYTPHGAGSPPLASRVAEMLGVSRASAGEMLKRLENDGLIERGVRKEALLTEAGRVRAEHVVRKHRLIERLLTDFMGYTGAEAHERADLLGDTFTDEMIERIDEKLGHPDRCPHGWPVDTDVEQRENAELEPLAALGAGTRATIVRLAEHDGELLHWFYDQGLVPGQEIEMRRAEPAADQFTVELVGNGTTASARSPRRPPPASSSSPSSSRRSRGGKHGFPREASDAMRQRANPRRVELFRGRIDAVDGDLAVEPRGDLGEPVVELDLRLVAERRAGVRDVGEAVADVAEAVLARELGLDLLADRRRELLADLAHGDARAAADVDRGAVGAVGLEREPERPRHVAHRDEVAALQAVLVHARRRDR